MTDFPWRALEPANVSFCEPRLHGFIAEPANAWSSVAYVAVGAWLLAHAIRAGRRALVLVGATGILIGMGSFALHASATFLGQFLDESSMLLLASLAVTLALRRARGLTTSTTVRIYVALAGSSILLLASLKTCGIVVFAAQIATAIVLELRLARTRTTEVRYLPMWLVLGMYAIASLAWLGDISGLVCARSSAHTMSGHVVWHVLTALCLVPYYAFQEQFTNEERDVRATPASRPGGAPPDIHSASSPSTV